MVVSTAGCRLTRIISILTLMLMMCYAARFELKVDDSRVVKESKFALKELKKLSDSTIYSTLEVYTILSAYEDEGIFHHNIILNLELSSPYFKSGLATERFEIFVMTHKEDSVKSFAINEFPTMKESAVEEFTILNMAVRKRRSEESFRRLELDALSFSRNGNADITSNSSIGTLLDEYSSDTVTALRLKNSAAIQGQLTPEYLLQELGLAKLTLGDLYQITVEGGIKGTDAKDITDFQKYRAKQLLDIVMAHLSSPAQHKAL